jgi:hypothetical protein
MDAYASFSIKYGLTLGDRLILQHIKAGSWIDEELRRGGLQGELPRNITIGYYRQLENDHPRGASCFMPINTPMARAALTMGVVQKRIGRDLLARLESHGQPPELCKDEPVHQEQHNTGQ